MVSAFDTLFQILIIVDICDVKHSDLCSSKLSWLFLAFLLGIYGLAWTALTLEMNLKVWRVYNNDLLPLRVFMSFISYENVSSFSV